MIEQSPKKHTEHIKYNNIWEEFITASDSGELCTAWLGLICSKIATANAAAILVESTDKDSFVPISVWPHIDQKLDHLGDVVSKAIRENKGAVISLEIENKIKTLIAYPLQQEGNITAVITIDIGTHDVHDAMQHIHWGSAWLINLFSDRILNNAVQGQERLSSIMESAIIALRQGKLQQSLFELSHELRKKLHCTRVAISLAKNHHLKLLALSESATFNKNTPLIKKYISSMEECYDFGKSISVDCNLNIENTVNNPNHKDLLVITGATHIKSIPMRRGVDCCGIITLERNNNISFSDSDIIWIDSFLSILTPIIEQRIIAERSSISKAWYECVNFLGKLFGPRHLILKTATFGTLLILSLMLLIHTPYRVTAKTIIEGETQRVAAAPFEGFLGNSFVKAGDTVRRGQALAQLDDRELKMEQARWESERDQNQGKLQQALAEHDLTAVQIVGAQLKQSESQYALITDKIKRAKIVAPYDGIVVSGDLSQQIGAPVELGKTLFEIAPLDSYRVILQVDEREISQVQLMQTGELFISGIASDPLPIKINKITPVATTQDGKNFFRVEAHLNASSARLRPGMEGVGKISVGNRQLFWILTHSFTDWLRLTLWTWLP
jgi:multidrug resistance efflux pump